MFLSRFFNWFSADASLSCFLAELSRWQHIITVLQHLIWALLTIRASVDFENVDWVLHFEWHAEFLDAHKHFCVHKGEEVAIAVVPFPTTDRPSCSQTGLENWAPFRVVCTEGWGGCYGLEVGGKESVKIGTSSPCTCRSACMFLKGTLHATEYSLLCMFPVLLRSRKFSLSNVNTFIIHPCDENSKWICREAFSHTISQLWNFVAWRLAVEF